MPEGIRSVLTRFEIPVFRLGACFVWGYLIYHGLEDAVDLVYIVLEAPMVVVMFTVHLRVHMPHLLDDRLLGTESGIPKPGSIRLSDLVKTPFRNSDILADPNQFFRQRL